jgi:hypothetical protein
MNRFFANFLSGIAHPIFINLLCLLALFSLFPQLAHGMPSRIHWFYISFIFISTSIIPVILVFVMRITGKINSLTLEKREERYLPYLITFILYFFNYYNFVKTPITHPLILQYLLACSAIVLAVFVINFFNKISIHMATLGALTGLLAVANFAASVDTRLLLIPVVLVSGLVASARYSLKAHQQQQLYLGYLLGFLLMFVILKFTINPIILEL